MKIKSISIDNVKSFYGPEYVDFEYDYNIFVGPNGGGKSNLLQIVVNLFFFLVKPYHIESDNDNNNQKKVRINPLPFSHDVFTKVFDKNYDKLHKSQCILLEVTITKEDLKRVNEARDLINLILTDYKDFLLTIRDSTQFLEEYFAICSEFIKNFSFEENVLFEYSFESVNLSTSSFLGKIFSDYLGGLEKLSAVIEVLEKEIAGTALNTIDSPVVYLGPNRQLSIRDEISINLGNNEREYFMNGWRSQKNNIRSLANKDSTQNYADTNLYRITESFFSLIQVKGLPNINLEKDIPVVGEINKYLKKYLDLTFAISATGMPNRFEINFWDKNQQKVEVKYKSSGEKELINFIFTLVPLCDYESLVLLDEPELHLHKKFQNSLLDLISSLTKRKNIQFLVTTHSPVFINNETINNVSRIAINGGGSCVTALEKGKLNNYRDLLDIINSQNNEKIFFADKIVLVEGISDRLIIEKMIDVFSKVCKSREIIEVIDTGSCTMIEKYVYFLNAFKVVNYSLFDFDYLYNKKGEPQVVKDCFASDPKGACRSVLSKDCKDKDYFIDCLDNLIKSPTSDNLTKIKDAVDYISERRKKIKNEITETEKNSLLTYILELEEKNNFFVLHKKAFEGLKGRLEDYLPEGYRNHGSNIESIIALVHHDNEFIYKFLLKDFSTSFELVRFVLKVLSFGDEFINYGMDMIRDSYNFDMKNSIISLINALEKSKNSITTNNLIVVPFSGTSEDAGILSRG